MTPEERDRLVTLEVRAVANAADIAEMKQDLKTLVAAANMGQGAFLAALKIGGVIVMTLAAAAWVYERVEKFIKFGH